MLLTLTTTHTPADDLSFLLHKHPQRFQSFNLSFGIAHVFYPEATAERCTVCLLVELDAVGLVRGRDTPLDFLLGQYVNDRPYVASSFLSVAIAQVFGSAMQGRSKDRPELAATPIPLEAHLDALAVRGGEAFLRAIFEPLGYAVEARALPLDERFPDWGDSSAWAVTLRGTLTLRELLTHLYVLIPVFDPRKHYWVSADETDKLLAKGEGWLAAHPLRDVIVRRYLRFQPSLTRVALARLAAEEDPTQTEDGTEETTRETTPDATQKGVEESLSLNDQRRMSVLAALRASGARSVVDLGCGEGKLLRDLLADKQFERIVGMDVSLRALEVATRRLRLDKLSDAQQARLTLLHGSLLYRDDRLAGFDAACAVEVIEHLDPPRLEAFERVVFAFARPTTVIVTTPNAEYNAVWESLPAGQFRHADHRFEWTRNEFQTWASTQAARFGYGVRHVGIGPEHPEHGTPTQMALFERGSEVAN